MVFSTSTMRMAIYIAAVAAILSSVYRTVMQHVGPRGSAVSCVA